jgi:hypothetical protein
MHAGLNAHRLLFSAPDDKDFHSRLQMSERWINQLRAARDIVRLHLTQGFGGWATFVDRKILLDHAYLRKGGQDPALRPKFHRQGSHAYALLNEPAHLPPQQVDFDDGMFLPVTFLKAQVGGSPAAPVIASSGYFALVQAILEPLCRKQGWRLDTSKPSCVRIIIDHRSHLDIALYAIPDDKFIELTEKAEALVAPNQRQAFNASQKLRDEIYVNLKGDEIMLAHREHGWKQSDPRQIEDWFRDAVRTHGEQLRRICRYLKAWRDYRWRSGSKLSSITIMTCAVDAFDMLKGTFNDARDDAALLMVARQLQPRLSNRTGVPNPILPRQILNDNWDAQDFVTYNKAAGELAAALAAAIETNREPEMAVDNIRAALGPRIPDDHALVVPVSAEATIKAYPAAKTPAPHVIRSHSG